MTIRALATFSASVNKKEPPDENCQQKWLTRNLTAHCTDCKQVTVSSRKKFQKIILEFSRMPGPASATNVGKSPKGGRAAPGGASTVRNRKPQ